MIAISRFSGYNTPSGSCQGALQSNHTKGWVQYVCFNHYPGELQPRSALFSRSRTPGLLGLLVRPLPHPEIRVGKVDVDAENGLAAQFGVMSIPTLVVIRNGETAGTLVGVQSKERVLELLG